MFPATFLNFGPACSAIFLLWSFGEINQLELSIYLDIYDWASSFKTPTSRSLIYSIYEISVVQRSTVRQVHCELKVTVLKVILQVPRIVQVTIFYQVQCAPANLYCNPYSLLPLNLHYRSQSNIIRSILILPIG